MLLLYSIAAGLLLGRLAGGRVRNLERVRFHWWFLAVGGLAVQLVLFAAPVATLVGDEGAVVYVVSTLAVLAALLRNLQLPGLPVIALGAVLNLVPVLANGGYMPSSPEAWRELTGSAALPVSHFTNVALIGPDTAFAVLGDLFVFPRPLPMATVFSIGDAVIAVGAVIFLVAAMRRPIDGLVLAPTVAPMATGR